MTIMRVQSAICCRSVFSESGAIAFPDLISSCRARAQGSHHIDATERSQLLGRPILGSSVWIALTAASTLLRHPEVAAKRPSKDDRPGPTPFEGLAFARPPQGDGEESVLVAGGINAQTAPYEDGRRVSATRHKSMAKVLTIVSLLGLLAFVLWVVYEQWTMLAVDMPVWGWAALIAGTVLSLLVGFGLMALMFYSSRHGYDEGAHQVDRDRRAG